MNKYRFEIRLIMYILLFSGIVYGIHLAIDFYNEKNSYIILLNPDVVLKCVKYRCNDISKDIKEYSNKDYEVYIDGESFGTKAVYYNEVKNQYYVYNGSYENIYNDYSKNLLAIDSNISFNVNNYTIDNVTTTELETIRNLSEINFDINNNLDAKKIISDLNNDGENEIIYTIDNLKYEDVFYFSILAFNYDNNIKIIEKNKSNDKKISSYNFKGIIDIYNDAKSEVIITNEFLNEDSCTKLYKFNNKSIKAKGKC